MPHKAVLSLAAASAVLGLALLGATTAIGLRNQREIQALRAQIAATRALLPTQSSAMAGVDFQVSSLWLAAEAGNWELADFLLHETAEHIDWAVDLQPVRQGPLGPVELEPLFQNMQDFSLKDLDRAVEARDRGRFRDAYGFVLDQCHGCHVAVGLDQLRVQPPAGPGSQMLVMQPPSAGADEPR